MPEALLVPKQVARLIGITQRLARLMSLLIANETGAAIGRDEIEDMTRIKNEAPV
jgi:hypothetical protein